jgi:phosphohistidine swiveling domain-containing protein
MIVFGTPMLAGRTEGFLVSEDTEESLWNSSIVISESLTNQLVVSSVNNRVNAIITRDINFASHAANILRALSINHNIVWIAGVEINNLLLHLGNYVFIREDGSILLNDNEIISCDNTIANQFKYKHSNSIAKLEISTGLVDHVYWPNSHFSRFAFSLMQDSLQQELMNTFECKAELLLSDMGKINFKGSPYQFEIDKFAADHNKSRQYFTNMYENYKRIYSCVSNKELSYSILCKCARMYFSTFIVLHRSYEYIFKTLYNWALNQIDKNQANELMDTILFCELDRWLGLSNKPLINKKVFLQEEPVAELPEFNIEYDLNCSINRIIELFNHYGNMETYNRICDTLIHYSKILVLKEWKFLYYKLIFTNIKIIIEKNGLLDKYTRSDLSNKTADEIGGMLD